MARIRIALSFEGVGLKDGDFERSTGITPDKYKLATVYHPTGYAWTTLEIESKANNAGDVFDELMQRVVGHIQSIRQFLLNNSSITCYLSIYCDSEEGKPSAGIRLSRNQMSLLHELNAELSVEVVFT